MPATKAEVPAQGIVHCRPAEGGQQADGMHGDLPALGMGVLVAVLTNSVGQQPVALVVLCNARFATRMARIIRADADANMLSEMTAAEAERAIGDQRVAGIIVIPENFDQGVARGTAEVEGVIPV